MAIGAVPASAMEAGTAACVSQSADTSWKAALAQLPVVPEFHGVIRTRYELDTRHGDGRFQVRNARLSAQLRVARIFTMFINTDFCDAGSMKILDAWAGADVARGVNVRMGQFRMPFGEDSHLGPANYIFANRSFIGKQMANYRAVGVQGQWTPQFGGTSGPLMLAAGVFNPYTITSHKRWTKSYAASAKARLTLGHWRLETGFMSVAPDAVRANMADVAVRWANSAVTLDAEYLYKHYTNSAHRPTHGYLVAADWRKPLDHTVFNRFSAQARLDGMTAHSSLTRNDGQLVTDHPLRNRLTLGATISHLGPKSLQAHLRLNYEKYFWGHLTEADPHAGDKLVAEFVISF